MRERGRWLLEVTLAGAVLRYASSDVHVTDARGRVALYRAGLTPPAMRLDGLEDEIGIEVVDRAVDWAIEVARGNALDRRPARLLWWVPGTVLEEARVILEGQVDAPEYGDPEAPARLVFSLREDRAAVYPDPLASVSTATWPFVDFPTTTTDPTFDAQIAGVSYPTVFGYPGWTEAMAAFGATATLPATPALLVQWNVLTGAGNSQLMVSAGRTDVGLLGGQVRLWAPDQEDALTGDFETDLVDVVAGADDQSRAVSLVEFIPGGDVIPYLGQRYYIGWMPTEGGGTATPDGSGPIRSLTDVALWALRRSGRRVDLQAQEGQRSLLDRYAVDGYVMDRIDTFRWFVDHLGALFPIVPARTSRGWYFRHVDWRPQPHQAVGHIETGLQGVERASPVRSARGDIRNVFSLAYAIQAPTGQPFARMILAAEAGGLPVGLTGVPGEGVSSLKTDDRVVASQLCRDSIARYGAREAPEVVSPFVWTDEQASRIIRHWAARDTAPRKWVSYRYADAAFDSLGRGDIVTVTDPGLGLTEAVAVVDWVRLSETRQRLVELEVLDPRFRTGG